MKDTWDVACLLAAKVGWTMKRCHNIAFYSPSIAKASGGIA